MACRRCRLILNSFVHPDGSTEWQHSRTWEEHDHDPEPTPADVVGAVRDCDFCSAPRPRWQYRGDDVSLLIETNSGSEVRRYGNVWSGCDACDRLIVRRDLAGLLERVQVTTESLTGVASATRPGVSRQLAEHRAAFVGTYVNSIRFRSVLPPPPPPMKAFGPALLPKVRDRLARYWASDRCADTVGHLPAWPTAAEPGPLGVAAGRQLALRTARDLADAALFWVSTEFTVLAVGAGKRLPDLALSREQLPMNRPSTHTDTPAEHGLVVYQQPIGESRTPTGMTDVIALSWTAVPGGVWAVPYVRVEQSDPAGVGARTEEYGWLQPASAGGRLAFGRSDPAAVTDRLPATLLATWFLIAQPGVADIVERPPNKATRRAYTHAGRRPPTVRVVDLRRRPQRGVSTATGEQSVFRVRWMVDGHWYDQAYGPGWSLHRRWFRSGCIKGPDGAPFKPKLDAPVVNALR
jgi:hypothetical protein